jgi:hypothetical protein
MTWISAGPRPDGGVRAGHSAERKWFSSAGNSTGSATEKLKKTENGRAKSALGRRRKRERLAIFTASLPLQECVSTIPFSVREQQTIGRERQT